MGARSIHTAAQKRIVRFLYPFPPSDPCVRGQHSSVRTARTVPCLWKELNNNRVALKVGKSGGCIIASCRNRALFRKHSHAVHAVLPLF